MILPMCFKCTGRGLWSETEQLFAHKLMERMAHAIQTLRAVGGIHPRSANAFTFDSVISPEIECFCLHKTTTVGFTSERKRWLPLQSQMESPDFTLLFAETGGSLHKTGEIFVGSTTTAIFLLITTVFHFEDDVVGTHEPASVKTINSSARSGRAALLLKRST